MELEAAAAAAPPDPRRPPALMRWTSSRRAGGTCALYPAPLWSAIADDLSYGPVRPRDRRAVPPVASPTS